jgi:hypothetical protein
MEGRATVNSEKEGNLEARTHLSIPHSFSTNTMDTFGEKKRCLTVVKMVNTENMSLKLPPIDVLSNLSVKAIPLAHHQ